MNTIIPIYDIRFNYIEVEDESDLPELKKMFKKLNIDEEFYDEIASNMLSGVWNGGLTFYDHLSKDGIIVMYPFDRAKKRFNVISHELRHLQDFILEDFNVKDMESAALLAGYLAEQVMDIMLVPKYLMREK